eukprot:COSAG05_NODE_612_length_8357_cov_40.832647_2_plen_280_part_00
MALRPIHLRIAGAAAAIAVCGCLPLRTCSGQPAREPHSSAGTAPRKASSDGKLPPAQPPRRAAVARPAATSAPAPVEVLSDDLLLLVMEQLAGLLGEAPAPQAWNHAVVRLLCAGCVSRLWRRVSSIRCLWERLCIYHYNMPPGLPHPLPCPRGANGDTRHARSSSSGSSSSSSADAEAHYRSLGVHCHASPREIAAAWRQAQMRAEIQRIARLSRPTAPQEDREREPAAGVDRTMAVRHISISIAALPPCHPECCRDVTFLPSQSHQLYIMPLRGHRF